MSDLITRLRRPVAYGPVGAQKAQKARDEAADEIERLQEEIEQLLAVKKVSEQFMLEVSHAMQSGPSWYTKGEDGLRHQIYAWIERMRKALEQFNDKE